MNEKLLRALMELFSIAANVEGGVTAERRDVVKSFLKQQVTLDAVDTYLKLFDDFAEKHATFNRSDKSKDGKPKKPRKGLPVRDSTKTLIISEQINTELTQKQKVVVLIRVLEFMKSDFSISDIQHDFVATVASAFNVSEDEFKLIKDFIIEKNIEKILDSPNVLTIDNGNKAPDSKNIKHIINTALTGKIFFLRMPDVDMYIMGYRGHEELYLNGLEILEGLVYIFANGSSIRSPKINPIYYSDIVGQFLSDSTESKISFVANHLEFKFPNGHIGLRDVNIKELSGGLIGLMGASGAGKTTLLNVLSGIETPSSGEVKINGINIHEHKDQIEGIIGYIAQDDLLIEELTVYDNLYFNAKLSFGDLGKEDLDALVLKTLQNLGLAEIRHVQVGSPLNKKISGGQRKRLNIALELIREPSVLFVDEPTSGLSSRDSENIMDLLKELSLKGKLIFVVIHQPSSDIFKMFDKLFIMDTGGYPIYYGNPGEAVIYFKKMTNHVNADKSECLECGNINPEQIFNIIESKVIDEYGNFTDKRKISPTKWADFYKENIKQPKITEVTDVPKSTLKLPSKLMQLIVFIKRDVLAKLSNTQFMVINFTEAPFLAFILAFLVRYFAIDDSSNHNTYIFGENENIVVYIFMSVIVALFMGLTVSAEEIIKDRKIRKREAFLNLSKLSYLISKVLILFVISAIQMITYVIIGNYILEIQGMNMAYFLVLFSTAFFANMLGLNVSASFDSAITIYILIPILLIPQLLLSGAVVKFDKLNPIIGSHTHVPLTGDLMASKWAFEALTVNQFMANEYEKPIYKFEKAMSSSDYNKNYLIPKLSAKVDHAELNYKSKDEKVLEEVEKDFKILKENILYELALSKQIGEFKQINKLTLEDFNASIADSTKAFLERMKTYYIRKFNYYHEKKDEYVTSLQHSDEAKEDFLKMKLGTYNDNLAKLVKNSNTEHRIIEREGLLIQKIDPIFLDPRYRHAEFDFRAHFFAPTKYFFGSINTFLFNIIIIWVYALILFVTLYFDVFRRILNSGSLLIEVIKDKLPKKK